jgi:uncharacterized protein
MPVRSSSSHVLRWPDGDEVRKAAESWARREGDARAELVRLGYFGSYANGTWGVGSDLDLVAVARGAGEPFERRTPSWDLGALPVPADLLICTAGEWARLMAGDSRFASTLRREAVWLLDREASS